MPYNNSIPHAKVATAFAYNPDTGSLIWKTKVSERAVIGAEAGTIKAARVKNGHTVSYRYVSIGGKEVTAARVAWLLHYGEWPKNKLYAKDGNPLNLRISNLEEAHSPFGTFDHKDREQRKAYHKARNAAFPSLCRESSLKKNFGITLAEYGEILVAQGGVCAICAQPETETRHGKVKALAVDHCHTTGENRGLLCAACNQAIGKFKDDRNRLLAAVRYLDKHSGNGANTITLSAVGASAEEAT